MKRSALLLIFLAAFCLINATDVSGNQSGTWTLTGSPYNIIGDVTVPLGSNLTIEPGVTVQAMGAYRINTLGSIQAIGTEADSIRFVSGMADPAAYWTGVRLEDSTVPSIFQYCYFTKATYGINSVNGAMTVGYSRFNLNEKGLQLYGIGETNPAYMLVTHCLIENSPHNAILVTQNSNAEIKYNEIRGNGTGPQYRGAIQLANQSAGGSCSPQIYNNHIHHNLKQGITAWDVVGASAINPTIHDNLIENNLTGIYLLNSSGYVYDNQIINNFIAGDMNSGAGVMVGGATSIPYFERNTITGNYTGFYITGNAMPVIGDLSVNHAWAQGENVIRNNIDANGTRHTVVCYQYSAATNIIKAENNYWDANDAAGINADITDHNDNAALPYVDFEPWLEYVNPSLINGSWTYTGQYQIANPRLQIISAENSAILHEVPITTENFAVSLSISEPFYAVMLATAVSDGHTLYGIGGGMDNPTVFVTSDLLETWIGNIEITDTEPFRYEKVGASYQEEGHTVYPVYNGFFVYQWDWVNHLYREGVYLKMLKHTRKLADGTQTWVMPENQRMWAKIENVMAGDLWTRYMIVDTLGTVRSSFVSPVRAADTDQNPTYLLIREFDNEGMISQRINTVEDNLRFYYQGLNMSRMEKVYDYVVEPDGTAYPLVAGNTWILKPQALSPAPTYLFFDPVTAYLMDRTVHLYFQPPSSGNWTHYRIYRNGALHQEIPVAQLADFHWEEDLSNNTPTYTYSICAWNGSSESAFTNQIMINAVANDDQIQLPRLLSAYPNPFGRAGIRIELTGSKAKTATVEIFNLRGQKLRSIELSGEDKLSWTWDAKDSANQPCGAGIYFVRLSQADAKVLTKRIVLAE
ncbi:MAG TPA: right-handed parallel beta-helix repeat-containing protein [Candidatus Cloacimonadota bacterium]|nr:right-handed parallel beta-helix repeat-containing protein [Candidatus Cloacimonadota bacterium]